MVAVCQAGSAIQAAVRPQAHTLTLIGYTTSRDAIHHLILDGQGVPFAVSLTGGNRNYVTQLLPLLDKIPAVAGRVGRPRQRAGGTAGRPRLRPRQVPAASAL